MRSVIAAMNFVDAPPDARRVARIHEPDGTSHHPLKAERVQIFDAREAAPAPSLAREGFALFNRPTALADFRDDEELRRVYLPEMAALVREVTEADEVVMTTGVGRRITDHEERAKKKGTNALEGAEFVHLDYSAQSVPDFLSRAIGESGIDPRRYSRILTYNLWRALSPPPQDMPLALCDMQGLEADDLVTAVAEFGARNYTFEISLARRRAAQRWYYFSNMMPDEVLMFKVWTLKPAWEPAVIHSAFYDPSCPNGAAARVSIEARAFALFE